MEDTRDQITQEPVTIQDAAPVVADAPSLTPLPDALTVLANHFLNVETCGLQMDILKTKFRCCF